MSKVRGVRFSSLEEKQLEEFLALNPYLDFSTLARIAIIQFINSPAIKLIPVKKMEAISKGEEYVRQP